jgi:ferritin-like metal-binding protein YciE
MARLLHPTPGRFTACGNIGAYGHTGAHMSVDADTIKKVIELGKQRFFERNPSKLQELEAIIARDENKSALDIGNQSEVARYRIIAAAAKSIGKDSMTMLLELGTDSKEELDQMIAAQNKQMKSMIGM